jgi:hypothetical protein
MENVEVKRTFIHPFYNYPQFYHDIAVSELGRRIEYDYDRFGDTPTCLGAENDLEGLTAIVQGYGRTSEGKLLSNKIPNPIFQLLLFQFYISLHVNWRTEVIFSLVFKFVFIRFNIGHTVTE